MAHRSLDLDSTDLARLADWLEITAGRDGEDAHCWEIATRLIAGYKAHRELGRYAAHTEDCEVSLWYAEGEQCGTWCKLPDDGHDGDAHPCDCGYDEALQAANATIDTRRK